jgi:murein DD-endopeptidase MepM/ murein hydrolase activator NlpD
MEEVLPRPRYVRSSSTYRKKKKKLRDTTTLLEKIIKQAFLCIIILIIVGLVKFINTPITNFVTDKVKIVLFQNIELKSIYEQIDGFFSNIVKSNDKENNDLQTNEKIIPSVSETSTDLKPGSDIKDDGVEAVGTSDTAEIVKAINLKYKFVTPVEGEISSPFGERMHPALKKIMFHHGVDIEGNKGSEILAALEGIIAETGNNAIYGNYIKIKSGDDIQTVYAHCSKVLYEKGEKIRQGQIIGNVGDTGLAVGAHLHFEVWVNEKVYDPMGFIKVII